MNEYKKKIIWIMNLMLPSKFVIWILRKPRLKIVDYETSREINWVASQIKNGIHHRLGNKIGLYRKYSHMVDKGLQSDEREIGRGSTARQDASTIRKKIDTLSSNDETLEWGDKINFIYDKFQTGQSVIDEIDIPIEKSERLNSNELEKIIKSRRSIRWFEKKEISENILNKILDTVNWASNSCNRQVAKIYITSDKNKIIECMKQNSGATCMNIPPYFLSFVADTRNYIMPTERNLGYIDVSLGAQNVMIMAESYGIKTCVLNWSHNKKNNDILLRKNLGIPDYELIIFNMVLGYGKKNVLAPSRKSTSNTIIWVGE